MEELIPIPMFKLYGDLSQEVRRSTYLKFCEIPSGVLFCTDVAARGLDMPNISWIVQYDVPSDPKSYIHRVRSTLIGFCLKSNQLISLSDWSYRAYWSHW